MTAAPIALLTDFGYRDHYVGVMHGVISSIAPSAPVIDITHGVPPQDVTAGALALRESWRFFPRGTIFVAVVDPGVGTTRRAIAVRTSAGAILVGPDNGVLWLVAEEAGLSRAVELQSSQHRLPSPSSTFHGRDIFAPAAAHLWNGVDIEQLGTGAQDLTRLELALPMVQDNRLIGTVIYVDGYGNLITNLTRAMVEDFRRRFPNGKLLVTIRQGPQINLYEAYGNAEPGETIALFGSFERLEVAIRDGNAAARYGAAVGMEVILHAYE